MLRRLEEQAHRIGLGDRRSDRLRDPGDVVARVRPRFDDLGITRLAEITGLDRVGYPVWAAVRPNAPTLSVCQGKGPTDQAAQASATMEAVEITMAERLRARRVASAATLGAEGLGTALLPELVRQGCTAPGEDDPIGWVPGHDLLGGESVWVPAEAVQIDATLPGRRYWQSSDGLGSGSLMVEAVLHGLCERVERDAGEAWVLRTDAEVAEACVDPLSFASAEVAALAEAIGRAGLHLGLFDMTHDLGLPCFFAAVSPPPDGREASWHHFDLASGAACRLDPARAAAAAIGEALQSRLTTISGARDDFQPDAYERRIAGDLLVYPRSRPARAAPRTAAVGIEGALGALTGALRGAGIDSLIVVPLHEDADVAVAKVIVSGLALPPGARARPHGARPRRAADARP